MGEKKNWYCLLERITYQTLEYRLNIYRCKRISPKIYSYRINTNWFLPYPIATPNIAHYRVTSCFAYSSRGRKKKKTPTNKHKPRTPFKTLQTQICAWETAILTLLRFAQLYLFSLFFSIIWIFFSFYNIKTY